MSQKITATPIAPDGTGAGVVLGDDSAGDLFIDPPPCPVERRALQQANAAFGASQFARGRGNRAVAFAWTVLRTHASLAAACAFKWAHSATVPVNCSLAIIDDGGTTNYSRAVIVEVAITVQLGKSTTTKYSVVNAVS